MNVLVGVEEKQVLKYKSVLQKSCKCASFEQQFNCLEKCHASGADFTAVMSSSGGAVLVRTVKKNKSSYGWLRHITGTVTRTTQPEF
jgi:hypothetical protein